MFYIYRGFYKELDKDQSEKLVQMFYELKKYKC
jgi:hypothetical protein